MPYHQLFGDVPTRWGSKAAMLERFLEQEECIRRVLVNDRKASHLLPGWQQIDVMKSVHQALKPLSEFTNILSGEKYATVSSILPLLSILNDICDESKDDEAASALTKEILDVARAYMQCKYQSSSVQSLLKISSLVDPRYKATYIRSQDLDMVKATIIDDALVYLESSKDDMTVVKETSSSDHKEPPRKKLNLQERLMRKRVEVAEKSGADELNTPFYVVKNELERYLSVSCEEYEVNPLNWWKTSSKVYPNLSQVARKYLCITATSTPSERLFSTAGGVITSKRNLLKPELAEMLIFLNRNA